MLLVIVVSSVFAYKFFANYEEKDFDLGMTFNQLKDEYNKQSKALLENAIGASIVTLFDKNITEYTYG